MELRVSGQGRIEGHEAGFKTKIIGSWIYIQYIAPDGVWEYRASNSALVRNNYFKTLKLL
jgi:hypothetical protein